MAKERMAFRKYPTLHDLESCHGVDLGKTKDSAKTFTHFIAHTKRQTFIQASSAAHFYSFIMDRSTDAGKVEDELVVICIV